MAAEREAPHFPTEGTRRFTALQALDCLRSSVGARAAAACCHCLPLGCSAAAAAAQLQRRRRPQNSTAAASAAPMLAQRRACLGSTSTAGTASGGPRSCSADARRLRCPLPLPPLVTAPHAEEGMPGVHIDIKHDLGTGGDPAFRECTHERTPHGHRRRAPHARMRSSRVEHWRAAAAAALRARPRGLAGPAVSRRRAAAARRRGWLGGGAAAPTCPRARGRCPGSWSLPRRRLRRSRAGG